MHLPRSPPLTERVYVLAGKWNPVFSIFVSSFASLAPFPTEDLKMTVGIRGTAPPSCRAVDLASVFTRAP